MSRGRPKKSEEPVEEIVNTPEEIVTEIDKEIVIPVDNFDFGEVKIDMPGINTDMEKIVKEVVNEQQKIVKESPEIVNVPQEEDEPEITERVQHDVMGSDIIWTDKVIAKRYSRHHLSQMMGKEKQDALVLTLKYFGVHKVHDAITFSSITINDVIRHFWCPLDPYEFETAWEYIKGVATAEEFLSALTTAANINPPVLYMMGATIPLE